MYTDYFSFAFLIIALALSIVNIYSMFILQKHLKSDLVTRSFDLLKKEVSLLNQKQCIHQAKTEFDASRLETLEKVLSAMITQSVGSYDGGDDGSNGSGTIH